MTQPPIRLNNPYKDTPSFDQVLLAVKVPKHVDIYFFKHVLAGLHGGKQNILANLLEKFYQECLRRGIAPVYDEENPSALARILADLNFNVQPISPTTSPRRRAPSRPPKRKGKSDVDGSQ